MSNYLVCIGFDNLNGNIYYDEKLGLVDINLDMENNHSTLNFSLNLSQAKVLNEFLANVIALANIKSIKKSDLFGDIKIDIKE